MSAGLDRAAKGPLLGRADRVSSEPEKRASLVLDGEEILVSIARSV